MRDMQDKRALMVETQIAGRGIADAGVLRAMREVPRHRFVASGFEKLAYKDTPLPIGEGQTISQPYIVARMIEAARLRPGDTVLEVGAGSGYAAAVMSLIARKVHAVERHAALAEEAGKRLAALGYANVEIVAGDGSRGLPEAAPFDAILVAAGGPEAPRSLKEQLAPGGRLVMPVGSGIQRLLTITRTEDGRYDEEDLGGVRFVPLVGEYGWRDDEAATS